MTQLISLGWIFDLPKNKFWFDMSCETGYNHTENNLHWTMWRQCHNKYSSTVSTWQNQRVKTADRAVLSSGEDERLSTLLISRPLCKSTFSGTWLFVLSRCFRVGGIFFGTGDCEPAIRLMLVALIMTNLELTITYVSCFQYPVFSVDSIRDSLYLVRSSNSR